MEKPYFHKRGLPRGTPLLCTSALIKRISNDNVKQSWYADAAAAGGILSGLRKWWDDLAKIGPDYGYFPNAKKTYLQLKITWTWSIPPDPPRFACLLLMYEYIHIRHPLITIFPQLQTGLNKSLGNILFSLPVIEWCLSYMVEAIFFEAALMVYDCDGYF